MAASRCGTEGDIAVGLLSDETLKESGIASEEIGERMIQPQVTICRSLATIELVYMALSQLLVRHAASAGHSTVLPLGSMEDAEGDRAGTRRCTGCSSRAVAADAAPGATGRRPHVFPGPPSYCPQGLTRFTHLQADCTLLLGQRLALCSGSSHPRTTPCALLRQLTPHT